MSAVPSPFAPRRHRPRAFTRGSLAYRVRERVWQLLISVAGKRHYVGSFATKEAGLVAREHVYQERLSGRPIPVYIMTEAERTKRAEAVWLGRKAQRRAEREAQAAAAPAAPPAKPAARAAGDPAQRRPGGALPVRPGAPLQRLPADRP